MAMDDAAMSKEEQLIQKERQDVIEAVKDHKCTPELKLKLLDVSLLSNSIADIKDRQFEKERKELRKKFVLSYFPVYRRISDMVSSVDKNLIESLIDDKDKTKYNISNDDGGEYQPIPSFWCDAIINSIFFHVNKKDKIVLSYLENIYADLSEDYSKFVLTFKFVKNPFFTHETLTKTYYFNENEDCIKCDCDEIKWASDEGNPCLKKKIKKNSKTKEVKEKYFPQDSFFDMFVKDKISLEECETESQFFIEEFFKNAFEYFLNFQDDSDDYEDE